MLIQGVNILKTYSFENLAEPKILANFNLRNKEQELLQPKSARVRISTKHSGFFRQPWRNFSTDYCGLFHQPWRNFSRLL
jgi:hypothetical protein